MNGARPSDKNPLEQAEEARREFLSFPEEEEVTGVTDMPSDAPKAAKVGLAALFSLSPNGRVVVICTGIVALVALWWMSGPAILSVLDRWVSP